MPIKEKTANVWEHKVDIDVNIVHFVKIATYPEIGDGNFNITHSHFID